MKFKNPLLSVTDLDRSIGFYKEVLGLRVIADFGANVTLTGGVALQREDSWKDFIGSETIRYGNDAELYFEEENFDAFIVKLSEKDDVRYVHPLLEHRWGQRVVRFYDPDGHIIEVGENLSVVCRRFLNQGMTVEQTAKRMEIPEKAVRALVKSK